MMSPSKPASVIGADLAIVGQKITLVCQSALVVAGEVSGDIHGDDVTVGETGKVNGTVSARNLSIHGEVNGELRGETVALYSTPASTATSFRRTSSSPKVRSSTAACAAPRMRATGSRFSTPTSHRSDAEASIRQLKQSSCRDR